MDRLGSSACINTTGRLAVSTQGLPENAIFLEKEAPAATYPQVRGFQKSGALFSGEKKAPAATYPQFRGFQKYGGLF